MTPAQQSALESVAGRTLSVDELNAIEPLLVDRNDVEIAAIINTGRKSVVKSLAVEDVYDVLFFSGDYLTLKSAQLAGDADAVMAFAVLLDAKQIGPGTVNIQAAPTVALFSKLQSSGLLSQAGLDALTARATVFADPIHYNTVSDALNIAEGRMTLGD